MKDANKIYQIIDTGDPVIDITSCDDREDYSKLKLIQLYQYMSTQQKQSRIQKQDIPKYILLLYGGDDWVRTSDLLHVKQAL